MIYAKCDRVHSFGIVDIPPWCETLARQEQDTYPEDSTVSHQVDYPQFIAGSHLRCVYDDS